jgi:hypothetical protein
MPQPAAHTERTAVSARSSGRPRARWAATSTVLRSIRVSSGRRFRRTHLDTIRRRQRISRCSRPNFRTTIKNDTLLIRPYVGTIYNVLDGVNRSSGADPSVGSAWTSVTNGTGCSVAEPCLIPDSASAAFRDQEIDRLHGTTVTLIHPLGEASLNLSCRWDARECVALLDVDPDDLGPQLRLVGDLQRSAHESPQLLRRRLLHRLEPELRDDR